MGTRFSNNKDNTTTKGGTGVTAGGDVSFGDVSGQVAIGNFIKQFRIEKPSGEELKDSITFLDQRRENVLEAKATVFISYSHKDEIWKEKLVTHLDVLQQEGLIDIWEDNQIIAGEDWHQKIQQAIETAKVAILLVSAEFLASDFIKNKEVPRLLERRDREGLWILPLILKPCVWDEVKWLARMQVRPKDGKAIISGDEYQIETNLATIAKEIITIIRTSYYEPKTDGTTLKLEKIKRWYEAGFIGATVAKEGQREAVLKYVRGEEENGHY